MHEHYASADYRVKNGQQDELEAIFREWFEWTRAEFPDFGSATLIRDKADAHHFVSWSSWRDAASRDHWRTTEGFKSRLDKVRAICDEFCGANHSLAVGVSERASEAKAA
jgi:quinol monooxygenase YgiN